MVYRLKPPCTCREKEVETRKLKVRTWLNSAIDYVTVAEPQPKVAKDPISQLKAKRTVYTQRQKERV
eukprot:7323032-Prymnesium_polylepis.1